MHDTFRRTSAFPYAPSDLPPQLLESQQDDGERITDLLRGGSPTGIKSITVTALHKAAKLVGGEAERHTSGHNYVLFRFPSGKKVELPHIHKRGGSRQTGGKHLKTALDKIIEAGVPADLLTHALASAGAVWHNPPETDPDIVRGLKKHRNLVTQGKWDAFRRLVDPPAAPQKASDMNTAPASPQPAATPPHARKGEPKWCGLSLRDVVELDLPMNPDAMTAERITRSFARQIARPDKEPFASLVNAGEVVRISTGRATKRYEYKITERAASTLAKEARTRYEMIHPTPEETKTHMPKPQKAQEKPAPVTASAPAVAPVAPQAQAPERPTQPAAPAPTPAPAPAPVDTTPLGLNEAIGALTVRFGVTLPFDDDLRLDLKAFVINLAAATR